MTDQILYFSDLQRLYRPKEGSSRPTLSTVEAWARRQGIPFLYDGQGGIFTTLQAVNFALGVGANDVREQPYRIEDLI